MDQPRRMEDACVQQVEDQTRHRLFRRDWENQTAAGRRLTRRRNGKDRAAHRRQNGVSCLHIFSIPDLPEIDDYYEPFTFD